jgi:tetratricopeptide (TPR) repeat protein
MITVPAERPMTPIPAYIQSDKDNSIEDIPKNPELRITNDLIVKLEKGVEVLKRKVGEIHKDVAVAIDAIAKACSDNEDYETALRHYNDALEMKKKILPQHHPSIADTLRSVADVSQKIGLMQDSEAAYKAAIAIYRKAFDDRSWVDESQGSKHQIDHDLHHMISTSLLHIGCIKYQKEEYDLAMDSYTEAQKEAKMSVIDAVVLDRHNTNKESTSLVKETRLFISLIMNNIANVHAHQNEKQKAVLTYNSALNLQMQEVGEDHLSVSRTLHNMGTMHYKTGELQLSLKCYKQVLKMRRLLLGNEHPSIADALMNIAIVHEKAGELDRAESALNATLRVVSRAYDEKDYRVAFVEDCLGALHARNNCEIEALGCFSRALTIYRDSEFDDNHPLVLSTKRSIEFIRSKNEMVPEEESYDMMSSFITCGGFCFTNNTSDITPATLVT